MTRRRKVQIGVGIGLGALAIVAIPVWLGLGDGGIKRQMDRAARLGLPMRPNDALPKPDPKENAGPELVALAKELSAWRAVDDNRPFSSNRASDAHLEALQPLVLRALSASRKPECAFGFDFENDTIPVAQDLLGQQAFPSLLLADARRLAKAGRDNEAFARLEASARIGALLGKSEPSHIASLMQSSLNQSTLGELERVLSLTGPHPSALDSADRVLDALGPLPNVKRAMVGEWAQTALRLPAYSTQELAQAASGYFDETRPKTTNEIATEFAYQSRGVRNRAVAHFMRTFLDYYEDLPNDPEQFQLALKATQDHFQRLETAKGIDKELTKNLVPMHRSYHEMVGVELARRRTLRTLIEALRTNARTLPGLQGDSMDPYSSNDLVFVRKGNAFTVYSIGPNRTDDGGDPTDSADIVARYPRVNPN